MGPDFLDRQSLWYLFSCDFIWLLFFIRKDFSSKPDIRQPKPDIKKGRIFGAALSIIKTNGYKIN